MLRQIQKHLAVARTRPNPTVGGNISTDLSGNVAIVTGAAGAIGSAVAEQLLRNGCAVCICDVGGLSRAMGGEWRDGEATLQVWVLLCCCT